jgi:hypothetical protein
MSRRLSAIKKLCPWSLVVGRSGPSAKENKTTCVRSS